MKLPLLDDDLAACVSCGLCLPHCPTFRVTGEERYSPRGRIEAIRQVHNQAAVVAPSGSASACELSSFIEVPSFIDVPALIDMASFTDMMDTCVQCRGCETACPSGVPFGRLMEGARQGLVEAGGYQPWYRRLGYRLLSYHRLVLAGSRLLAVAQRSRLVPSGRLGLPERLALRSAPLRPGVGAAGGLTVWLHTGCVMDAWQRPVHRAALAVLEAMGVTVLLPLGLRGGGCCGALANHAGLVDIAREQARATMTTLTGATSATSTQHPILVDSAGCGAQLKDVGHLLGSPEGEHFAARVFDVNEWIAGHSDLLPPARPSRSRQGPPECIAVQDPCHLRHVQRVHGAVREMLAPYLNTVELDDEGLCCGAGGAYSVLQPDLAGAIRTRKLEAIARSGATTVASANPGCSMHLAAAGVNVRHPVELLADALGLQRG